jgi:hypothetical protein
MIVDVGEFILTGIDVNLIRGYVAHFTVKSGEFKQKAKTVLDKISFKAKTDKPSLKVKR